jgi:non-homologous end joining protein Ku
MRQRAYGHTAAQFYEVQNAAELKIIQDVKISKDMLNLAKRIVAMKAGAMFTN